MKILKTAAVLLLALALTGCTQIGSKPDRPPTAQVGR